MNPFRVTRNPFQVGDYVVANGFKYNGHKHHRGTNSAMVHWQTNESLLSVRSVDAGGDCQAAASRSFIILTLTLMVMLELQRLVVMAEPISESEALAPRLIPSWAR